MSEILKKYKIVFVLYCEKEKKDFFHNLEDKMCGDCKGFMCKKCEYQSLCELY